MVFVNNMKYACESCIKGHRSSSCSHTDRPLFEIKKKGRPVSQCTSCRELRNSKKLHSKCTCDHRPQGDQVPMQPVAPSSKSKTKRFIPITPSLPNGLKDAIRTSDPSLPADARQRVDTLLNPCSCKSLWKCKCQAAGETGAVPQVPSPSTSGLNALASAAAAMQSCCSDSVVRPSEPTSSSSNKTSRPRSPANSISESKKRRRHGKSPLPSPQLDLPPFLYNPSSPSPGPSSSEPAILPDFGFMAPPISQITSIAGSGCTCGVLCACPGCVEHRGSTHATHDRRTCGEGCGTCVDPSLGMGLPQTGGAASSLSAGIGSVGPAVAGSSADGPSSSILDKFFARAAALPPPPRHRRMSSVNIDPRDTSVFTNAAGLPQVNLPKLECCGGKCTCPAGQCGCQDSCVGCGGGDNSGPSRPTSEGRSEPTVSPVVESPHPIAPASCCAGKK